MLTTVDKRRSRQMDFPQFSRQTRLKMIYSASETKLLCFFCFRFGQEEVEIKSTEIRM
jgi:hypothetical protein